MTKYVDVSRLPDIKLACVDADGDALVYLSDIKEALRQAPSVTLDVLGTLQRRLADRHIDLSDKQRTEIQNILGEMIIEEALCNGNNNG